MILFGHGAASDSCTESTIQGLPNGLNECMPHRFAFRLFQQKGRFFSAKREEQHEREEYHVRKKEGLFE